MRAMASSIRRERRLPWEVAVTVVGWMPSSRAIQANDEPASRKRILMNSCCSLVPVITVVLAHYCANIVHKWDHLPAPSTRT